ncbi:hypothetical protein ONZ45_g16505 [Pleurotus djamor]|nr:hypothetical protein ONZ45_g16505 [Pleurotus djamor]
MPCQTHGNTDSRHTAINAARCLHAFGAPEGLHVYPGASKPLILPPRYDAEIHGDDGLGGVEGLLSPDDPALQKFFVNDDSGRPLRAIEGMFKYITETWKNGQGSKVCMISSGPMTNVALFISVYPDLLDAIDEFVFMGGGVGIGNRSPVAEWNILCDPHAAQIVLDAPIKKTMIPLNVTHTAIVTKSIRTSLLDPTLSSAVDPLPPPVSNLRHTLSSLITFFAEAYKSTFGFNDGPPLHDALTVLYVSRPELFKYTRYRVDIELTGLHSIGQTVVDVWHYQKCDDSWGPQGKNCLVTESVDVSGLFKLLLEGCLYELLYSLKFKNTLKWALSYGATLITLTTNHTNMPSQTMHSTASSKKTIFKRLFKSAKTEQASVEEAPRKKVSKSQIKLLYVDTSKRDAADMTEWRRPQRRAVSKDQICLVGVDCRMRMAADAGVELVDDVEECSESDEETLVGDDECVYSVKAEEFKVLDDGDYAEADCSLASIYSMESMWSFSSEYSTDSEFCW